MDLSQHNVNLHDILGWVNDNDFNINLSAERIGFLLAIYSLQRTSDSELTEEVLVDLYRQVVSFKDDSELTDNTLAARANKLINDLVNQKILNRFSLDFADDEDLTEKSSIYRLSPLAIGIAENYFRQKEFSQVGLSVQLAMVAKEINAITEATAQVGDYLYWRQNVYAPLRFTVAEVFDLIDYRQRELDEEQHQIKQRIADLLSKQWHDAIDNCELLLSSTGDTLRELQDTLSSAGDKLQSQLIAVYHAVNQQKEALQNIELFASEPELRDTLFSDQEEMLDLVDRLQASFPEANDRMDLALVFEQINSLIQHLQTKLDRIISWGQQSIDLWIGFDKHIHRFIRNTIDLDKNRVFSTRLRRSVSEFLDQRFYLTLAAQERIMEMRDETPELVEGEALGDLPEDITYETFDNIQEQISTAMHGILQPFAQKQEPLDVALILRQILRDNPLAVHFDVARIFIEQAMRMGTSSDELAGVQAEWQAVNEREAQIQANIINSYQTPKN